MAKEPSRYERWKEKYSFDECELDNKEYGHYLSSYLRSQKKPLVLNLNGAWGTGKTVFLKQMYSNLRYDHEYPVIYIDAWRSDFSNDPLLVVISEMIDQFKQLDPKIDAEGKEKELFKVLGKYSKKLWNVAAIGVGSYASKEFDNGTLVELAKTATFKDDEEVIIGRNLTDNYKNQLSALHDTKTALKQYVDGFSEDKRKVFVLVDELDRCRPTYAIEMLETIKHFFSLDNYIFVVATDTNQLSHSIKAVYGSEFDGSEYLSRFFNRSAALPEPDKELFAKLLVKDTLLEDRQKDITIIGQEGYSPDFISRLLHEVSVMYNLSLRRMEQVFRKFESCVLFELDSEDRYLDYRLLMQLIAEYDSVEFRACYDARKNALGISLGLPQEFKTRIGSNSDDPLVAIQRKHLNDIQSIDPQNKELVTHLINQYQFSWIFVNDCSNESTGTQITLRDAHKALGRRQNQRMQSPSYRQDAQDIILERFYRYFTQLMQTSQVNGSKGFYTRKDYFNAVELSSSLTNE
ncbi:hypothetical protein EK599_12195 [Vibrio sp. T187]|uniref:KAP family P-loop NTPase fold protein n=1 Tax=Vibrio TaxID=662 RepID=UPI0010C94808|nr:MULTISPECIES: P-loop NTPase fold protein [Vibrio]MBW3696457.1 hypothetical protein [Vibrio sp. T187]